MSIGGLCLEACCGCCRNSDVVLLTDTTGSMGGYISNIKAIFTGLEKDFNDPSCRWIVADYKDYEDGGVYQTPGVKFITPVFTNDWVAIKAAVNALSAGGGGDGPEGAFLALEEIASKWETTLGGYANVAAAKRVVIWGGDAPSWNADAKAHPYPSEATLTDALVAKKIHVIGINSTPANGGIDGQAGTENNPGQAKRICKATDGFLFNSVTTLDQIKETLCFGLNKGV